jgi:hypothetical protein
MTKTTGSPSVRRSSRVNIGCPVKISGKFANSVPFVEETQVTTVSKFGAKLRTLIPLQVGMQIRLAPLHGKNSGVFKVVWVGREGTPRAGEVGIEHAGPIAKVLGINFPDLPGLQK